MAQDPDAPIFNAIKLTRLREHMIGFSDGQNSVGDILRLAVDALTDVCNDERISDQRRRKTITDLLDIQIRITENVQNSLIKLGKLVPSLQALHLDISIESKTLKEIDSRLETINIQYRRSANNFVSSVEIVRADELWNMMQMMNELSKIIRQLSSFCGQIDQRILDVLTVVAQTIDQDRFQHLYNLLTKEI